MRAISVVILSCIVIFAAASGAADFTLSEQDLQRYTGDFWEATEAFAAEVRVTDGKLWAVHSPTRRNELVPISPDRFEMIGMPAKVIIEYTMGPSGIVEMRRTIDGQARGRFTPFTPREVTAEELADYTGEYATAAGDFHFVLTVEDGKLLFRSGDRAKQELTALFDDTFEQPDVGSFIFSRNADGAVTGFLLRSRTAPSLQLQKQ